MSTSDDRSVTLAEVIEAGVDAGLRATRVMMPGRVTAYDAATQRATVQLTLKYTPRVKVNDDGTVDDPEPELIAPLISIPVWWPRVGGTTSGPQAVIYMPLKPGALVMCLFADRSLEFWRASRPGEDVDPQDTRVHDLSDGVAIPGLYPDTDPFPDVDPSDIRVVLKWPERGIDSEFYLGGDTGDVVFRPSPTSGTITGMVRLGAPDAAQSAVLGELFMQLFNLHVHDSGIGLTGPPTLLTQMTNAQLSPKVKVSELP